MRRRLAAALILALAPLPAAARSAAPLFTPGGPIEARAALDGASLTLADGRILHLAGIETPQGRGSAALAARATAALDKFIAGGGLATRFAGNPADRHGDVVAALFAHGKWVERALVQRGLARVHGAADNRIGLAQLLAAEATARRARRGIWRLGSYAVLRPEDAARHAGSFALVEGTVAAAGFGAGAAYLDFGPGRGAALGVRIAGPALKLCRAAGLDPVALRGARLRVRGFIDGRVHPRLEVSFPEQIELLHGPARLP